MRHAPPLADQRPSYAAPLDTLVVVSDSRRGPGPLTQNAAGAARRPRSDAPWSVARAAFHDPSGRGRDGRVTPQSGHGRPYSPRIDSQNFVTDPSPLMA